MCLPVRCIVSTNMALAVLTLISRVTKRTSDGKASNRSSPSCIVTIPFDNVGLNNSA